MTNAKRIKMLLDDNGLLEKENTRVYELNAKLRQVNAAQAERIAALKDTLRQYLTGSSEQ